MHSKMAMASVWRLYFIIAIASIVLPVVSGMLLTGIRKLNGLQMANGHQRKMLLLASLVYQTMLIYLFQKAGLDLFILPFYIGLALILLAAYVIHSFMQISLHAMGWGGFTAMTVFLLPQAVCGFYWIIIAAVLASGLVMSARLFLEAHSRTQIYLGYSIAFIIMAGTFIFYGHGI